MPFGIVKGVTFAAAERAYSGRAGGAVESVTTVCAFGGRGAEKDEDLREKESRRSRVVPVPVAVAVEAWEATLEAETVCASAGRGGSTALEGPLPGLLTRPPPPPPPPGMLLMPVTLLSRVDGRDEDE